MDVSLYLHFKKIRVAFHTIEVETIVIFNMEIYDTLIGSEFDWLKTYGPKLYSIFKKKIQPTCSMTVSLYLHLEKIRVTVFTIPKQTIEI